MKKYSFKVSLLLFILAASSLIIIPQIGLSAMYQWRYLGPQATNVSVLAVDPHNSSSIYAGTFYQGIYKSIDWGLNWNVSPLIHSFTSIGFDPNIPGTIYALAYYYLYKSTDGGESWTSLNHPDANCMEHDPEISSVLYLGAYKSHPDPEWPGGVFRSVDGGNSWNDLGLNEYDIQALAIDPSNRNIIYAATSGTGIFKSTDGGLTWKNINPVMNVQWNTLKVDPHFPLTLYAGTWGAGILKSTDGGVTWNSINSGLTHLDISSLAIDPNSSSTIYAGTVGGGVFFTEDGGATWVPVNDGLPINEIASVAALAIKRDFPMTLYAGTGGGGLNPDPKEGVYALIIEKSLISVAVTSPIAGELWPRGTTKDVKWTATGLTGNVIIDLYEGGSFSSNIGTAPISIGTYSWSIPPIQIPGNDYKVRIYQGPILGESGDFSITNPTISLGRTNLFFGAETGKNSTKSQIVLIGNSGFGTLNWTATPDQSWIAVQPTSGTGTTQLTVGVNPLGLGVGTYTGTISIAASGSTNSPQTINITLRVYGGGTATSSFGYFETPVNGTTGIEGAVPVSGWALDDIEVTKVDIWRDPVADEPVHPNGYVYIGDAVFVEGARPDIEAAYPTHPLNYRAGWGYMMLTNFLPGQGNGTYRIYAIAYDKDGHSVTLGTKTIACDNAHATLPFGTIDTPGQGETWNGTQVNFGWALTPMPKSISVDGSAMLVWIDGLPLGHPTYNNYREDIATLFPGFANSNGAVGYYYVDTTQYANGVHTIAWSVEDSAAAASGIGSRYFRVVNTGTGTAARLGKVSSLSISGESGQSSISSSRDVEKVPTDYSSPVHVKRGYDLKALAEPIFPDKKGVATIETLEVDRIEIALSEDAASESELSTIRDQGKSARTKDRQYVGYLVVGGQLRPLPLGSILDSVRGVFSWQLGPGFVGEYSFVFISQSGTSNKNKKNVKVRILPAFQRER